MSRKERILEYMKSESYVPLKFEELAAVLDVPPSDTEELRGVLDALVMSGRVILTKRGRYMAAGKGEHLIEGALKCSSRGPFGFLICEDEDDIFIREKNMLSALNGDRVLVREEGSAGDGLRREGRVVRILERANKNIVGVLTKRKDGSYRITPDERRVHVNVRVSAEDVGGASEGDRVSAEITGYTKNGKPRGRVTVLLGEADSLKSMTEGIILQNHIKREFDPKTVAEAEKAPSEVSEADIRGREDFRDKLIFTIDGDDARDFDDAVSLEMTKDGNYLLGVHIADVTHYVKRGSALDREALERGTSVYLADRVIPMLPRRLSNGICSLNPNADRLTLSVIMEIDGGGKVIGHELKKSVIRSKERMTYKNVTALLEGDDPILNKRYAYLMPVLRKMAELSRILEEMRNRRGAIGFDFPETYIEVDENGEPTDVLPARRGISNKMIEEFMLCANETVAEYAYWSELPFIYRVHDAPSAEKITAFNKFALHFGLGIKGRIDSGEPIHPKALQAVLDKVRGKAEERMVASEMLHSLMKAEYSPENRGHFGLAARYYCHFTSPIRRYPDLMIHRILKAFIDGGLTERSRAVFAATVGEAARRSSEKELDAEHTERECDDLMKTAYMSRLVGESFDASVANVTGFGMFAELDNSIEGLIRLESMADDYYIYDDEQASLRGKRTGREYRIGDRIRVTLVHTDLLSRRIDFVLEKDVTEAVFAEYEDKKPPRKRKSKERNGKGHKSVKKK